MKTTSFFIFLLFTLCSVTHGQDMNTTFSFKSTVSETFFTTPKKDVTSILIVDKPNKTILNQYSNNLKINLFPQNYSWSKDLRKLESYKELILNARRQDLCGRDLPADVHYEVTQQVYLRNLSF